MKVAVVVVDMQHHFFDETPRLKTSEFVGNTAALLKWARSGGTPVVHVVTEYRDDKSNWPRAFKSKPKLWCMAGSAGVHPIPEAVPLPAERVIHKSRYSAFWGTDLDQVLRGYDVDAVLIAGYSCDVCLRFSAVDAFNIGYTVLIASECVESMLEDRGKALAYLEWLIECRLVPMNQLDSVCRPDAKGSVISTQRQQ